MKVQDGMQKLLKTTALVGISVAIPVLLRRIRFLLRRRSPPRGEFVLDADHGETEVMFGAFNKEDIVSTTTRGLQSSPLFFTNDEVDMETILSVRSETESSLDELSTTNDEEQYVVPLHEV